jgi:hypothetical protein
MVNLSKLLNLKLEIVITVWIWLLVTGGFIDYVDCAGPSSIVSQPPLLNLSSIPHEGWRADEAMHKSNIIKALVLVNRFRRKKIFLISPPSATNLDWMQPLLPPSSSFTTRPLQQSSSEFGHVPTVESLEVTYKPSVTNLVRFLRCLGPA